MELSAINVNEFLRSLCPVAEKSVDRIVIGDPNTKVTRLGTAWMPYLRTLEQAVAAGVNTLVVHEPTFYTHWDLDEKTPDYLKSTDFAGKAYSRMRDRKRHFIEKNSLVIIRCHDVLDAVPEFGIPFSLGEVLGYNSSQITSSKTYYNVYGIDPAPAGLVAARIASRLEEVDQPGVAFYGDPDRIIKSVGVGTGCICNPMDLMDLEPDLFVAIDDTIRTWVQATFAEDTGWPLVVINHGASEEFGVRRLNQRLREAYPGLEVLHYNQGCGYRWITG